MKVVALFTGIFIISGFSCLVLGADGDLVPDKLCEYLTAQIRSMVINFQYISIFGTMEDLKLSAKGDICELVAIVFNGMEETACKDAQNPDKGNIYLKKLQKYITNNNNRMCSETDAIKISVECIEKLKKKSEFISCHESLLKKLTNLPKEQNAMYDALSTYKFVNYNNMTSVCCAIRNLANCYKKVASSCKTVHETLVPMMYEFVEFQLTGRVEENVCIDEVCGSDSTSISSRLQCLQPKLMITLIIVVHILSRAIY